VSSACAVDFVTVDCLLIRISMGPSPLMPIYDPVWDFLSGLLANDASMYACTPNLFSDFHVMLLCGSSRSHIIVANYGSILIVMSGLWFGICAFREAPQLLFCVFPSL